MKLELREAAIYCGLGGASDFTARALNVTASAMYDQGLYWHSSIIACPNPLRTVPLNEGDIERKALAMASRDMNRVMGK
jgi:hypothetical protein